MSPLTNLRRLAVSLAMFAVIAFGSATAARADQAVFNLTVGPTLGPGNYGTITLTLSGGSIIVDVQLTNGAIINGGQQCSICFNSTINPNISVSAITANYQLIASAPGVLHADGFGDYEYGVDYVGAGSGGGCTQCVDHVTFTVSKTSGTFSSVFELVENSTGGGFASPFAVDIRTSNTGGSPPTGFVGTTGPVPEPASMFLLGTGLLGIGAGIRKRFRK